MFEQSFVVAGMACCSTLYLGHTLHNIFAVLQTPGSQIQSCSFKSKEAPPSPHGSEAKGKGCVIEIVLKPFALSSPFTVIMPFVLLT